MLLPFAALPVAPLYSSGAVLFCALSWFGLAATLLLFGLAGAAPWRAGEGLRVRAGFAAAAQGGFRLGTLGAYLTVLLALGAVADRAGPLGVALLVPIAAALTYLAVWALRTDPGPRGAPRGWRPDPQPVSPR